jgi:hypothetical protein
MPEPTPPKAEDKDLTEEQKADKKIHEANDKRREEKKKLVNDTLVNLQTDAEKAGDPTSTQEVIKEVADRASKTQVVAAGARYGPSPTEIDELSKQVFPIVAPPLPDGTPVANIAQVERKEEKDKPAPKDHAVTGKK